MADGLNHANGVGVLPDHAFRELPGESDVQTHGPDIRSSQAGQSVAVPGIGLMFAGLDSPASALRFQAEAE